MLQQKPYVTACIQDNAAFCHKSFLVPLAQPHCDATRVKGFSALTESWERFLERNATCNRTISLGNPVSTLTFVPRWPVTDSAMNNSACQPKLPCTFGHRKSHHIDTQKHFVNPATHGTTISDVSGSLASRSRKLLTGLLGLAPNPERVSGIQ